ncbi:MAG: tetratricopeptide repeat protein [Desulfarculales bacterium]|jgi:tetratricopeptide (TPR) repeat protein|nr:tetratricopeptide repeat protein [Desulfarculales bacterium]
MSRIWLVSLALAIALTWTVNLRAEETGYNLGIIVVKEKNVAENLRQRIIKGENFEDLAQTSSMGPNARRGGRLGTVTNDSLRGEYREALQGIKAGQVSKIVAIEDGYALLYLFPEDAAAASGAGSQLAPPSSPSSSSPPLLPSARQAQAGAAALAPPMPSGAEEQRMRFIVNPDTSQAINVDLLTLVVDALEFMQQGELKKAEASLLQAQSLDPDDDSVQLLLGVVREGLAGIYPSQAVAAMADAFSAMIGGNGEEALAQFNALGEQNPRFWQVFLMAGSLRLGIGDLDVALEQLNEAARLKPDYARIYLVIGNVYFAQFKGQDAEAAYVKALQMNPGMADGYYFLGRLYMAHGEVEFAEQEYRRALELNPLMYEAYNDLGSIYLYSKRPQEAEESFINALKINPGMAPALVNLGVLYVSQAKWDKAKSLFEMAVERSAVLPEAHYNLGLIFIHEKNWPDARNQLEIAGQLGYPVPEQIMKMLADGEAGGEQ